MITTIKSNHQPVLPPVHFHHVLKAAALKATPGKYCWARSGRAVNVCAMVSGRNGGRSLNILAKLPVAMWRSDEQMHADAEFMSLASPEHILQVVDVIEAQEARINRLESVIDELKALMQEARKCV